MTTREKMMEQTPKLSIRSLRSLRDEMVAVAKGERAPSVDAGQSIFSTTEAIARLLNQENRRLLNVIDTLHPQSVAQLAELVQRAEPNVSRTLAKLAEAGIVEMINGEGRAKIPRLRLRELTFKIFTTKWADQLVEAH
jgi:predicted transcriptional regulator